MLHNRSIPNVNSFALNSTANTHRESTSGGAVPMPRSPASTGSGPCQKLNANRTGSLGSRPHHPVRLGLGVVALLPDATTRAAAAFACRTMNSLLRTNNAAGTSSRAAFAGDVRIGEVEEPQESIEVVAADNAVQRSATELGAGQVS